MKFSCEKALLNEAINIVARAVAPKSTVPVVEGILLEAGAQLRLTGFNLETGIRTVVDAGIREMGAVVLNPKLFGDIIRRLPDDMVTMEVTGGDKVTITCGMVKYDIIATSADEYPDLPEVKKDDGISVTQAKMKSMIAQTLFAVSDNDIRPIHTGSLFDVEGNVLTLVSVDGYRLAMRKEEIMENEVGKVSFVVPGAALTEVEKICADSDEEVFIKPGDKHIVFNIGNTMLVSRRLEGEFLNYKQAIPRNNSIKITADRKLLISSIERVSLIINDRVKTPVRCKFGKDILDVSSSTTLGTAEDQCIISGDGGDLEIGFNNRYLLEALKAAAAEQVVLELNTGISPCIMVPAEGEESFLYMVLPVRLR